MGGKRRVVHYVNQFFGGFGGEADAWMQPVVREGCVGPGQLLAQALGGAGEIVATVICGDNQFSGDPEPAARAVVDLLRDLDPDIVIAGPAFASGRYGIACGQICAEAVRSLGIPAVASMHEENPAVEMFRQSIHIVPASVSAVGLRESVARLAPVALKLMQGVPLGPATEEGYLPHGVRRNVDAGVPAARRACAMLLAKMRNEPFQSELRPTVYPSVPPAPALGELEQAKIAFVTEAALVPLGNPDRLPRNRARTWLRYEIGGLSDLSGEQFESVHSGFDVRFVNEDPDRVIPLDALRSLQRSGEVGELFHELFVTAGSVAMVREMKRMGREMAAALTADGVTAVVLPAT